MSKPFTTEYPRPGELFSLSGDVAVVTGGGRGIGEGIARTLAAAGAKVVVAARREEEVEAVARQIRADGGEAIAVVTDVTDDADVDALAVAAKKAFGALTIWVNNAGGSAARLPMTELSRADWNHCIALNLTAVWVGIVAAAKHMERGSIINISSGAGSGPVPGSGASRVVCDGAWGGCTKLCGTRVCGTCGKSIGCRYSGTTSACRRSQTMS